MRGPGKSSGAFGFSLNFFAPLFCFKTKKWKANTRGTDEKSIELTTAMLRHAQNDKAQEAEKLAVNLKSENYFGYLKKLMQQTPTFSNTHTAIHHRPHQRQP